MAINAPFKNKIRKKLNNATKKWLKITFKKLNGFGPKLTKCHFLWDCFSSITRSYYRNSVGIIIVYDITNHQSFEHVSDWLAEAEANISGPNPPQCVFLIVGHKADLNAKREVLYEEGEYLAKYRKAKFVETSALTGENVNVNY